MSTLDALPCDAWRAVVRWLPVVDAKRAASTCRSAALAARREVIERVVEMRARFLAALDDDIERTRAATRTHRNSLGYVDYDVGGSSVFVKRRIRRIVAAWSAMVIERGDARRPVKLWLRFHRFTLQASSRPRGRTVVRVTTLYWGDRLTQKKTTHRWGDGTTAMRKLSQLYDDALNASFGDDDDRHVTNSRFVVEGDVMLGLDNRMLGNIWSLLAHVRRVATDDDMNRVAPSVTLDGYQAQLSAALDECAWLCNHCRDTAGQHERA